MSFIYVFLLISLNLYACIDQADGEVKIRYTYAYTSISSTASTLLGSIFQFPDRPCQPGYKRAAGKCRRIYGQQQRLKIITSQESRANPHPILQPLSLFIYTATLIYYFTSC